MKSYHESKKTYSAGQERDGISRYCNIVHISDVFVFDLRINIFNIMLLGVCNNI